MLRASEKFRSPTMLLIKFSFVFVMRHIDLLMLTELSKWEKTGNQINKPLANTLPKITVYLILVYYKMYHENTSKTYCFCFINFTYLCICQNHQSESCKKTSNSHYKSIASPKYYKHKCTVICLICSRCKNGCKSSNASNK